MTANKKASGSVIRYFMSGYYLCDSKPPEGCKNDGEIYIGNPIKWFKTLYEAKKNMLNMINAAYDRYE